MSEDLILVPEVQARRMLPKQPVRIVVLAPYGAWNGCGMLRVLRLKIPAQSPAQDDMDDREVELTVGYESYEPLTTTLGTVTPPEAVS